MKLNKINLALVLLAIVSLLMAIRFDSGVLGVFTIGFLVTLAVRTSSNVSAENVASGVESATIGELINEQLNDKARNKLARMSGEEKNKLAHRFAHEIGSDTQPLTFKKHSITGEKA